MQKWEYMRASVNPADETVISVNGRDIGSGKGFLKSGKYPTIDEFLMNAGHEGWELIAVDHLAIGSLFFKRSKPK